MLPCSGEVAHGSEVICDVTAIISDQRRMLAEDYEQLLCYDSREEKEERKRE